MDSSTCSHLICVQIEVYFDQNSKKQTKLVVRLCSLDVKNYLLKILLIKTSPTFKELMTSRSLEDLCKSDM